MTINSLTQKQKKSTLPPEPSVLTGCCDRCGNYAELFSRRGLLLCQACRDKWDYKHTPATSSGEAPYPADAGRQKAVPARPPCHPFLR